MFKIPDWGEDVPKSNIDVSKLFPSKTKNKGKQNQSNIKSKDDLKNNNKNKGKSKLTVTGNLTKIKKVKQPKYKAKKFVHVSPKVNNVVNNRDNTPPSHNVVDIQNCDTDKLDEVILDAKKKNLVDSYKIDDNEEELFTEKKEKISVSAKKNREINDNGLSHGKRLKKEKIGKRKLVKKLMQSKIHSDSKTDITKETNKLINSGKSKSKSEKQKEKIKSVLNVTDKPTKMDKNKRIIDKTILSHRNTDIENTNTKDISSVPNANEKNKKLDHKKEVLKNMLQSRRTPINVSGNKLRERMLEKLNAAKFRFLNEKLYTSSGSEAQKLFQEDPAAFQTYHQGYQQQVKKWPVNPLDVVVKRIKNLPKTHLIADLGCGEAALSKRVTQTVRSFDLVATAPGVEVCDMAHTPLLSSSMDVAVYCLALMGTDLTQYLCEANRFLKMGGHLLIAEVESRFDDVDAFAKEVQRLGFTLRKLDKSHKVFYFMEFTKAREAPVKKSKLPSLSLKPCIYKRR